MKRIYYLFLLLLICTYSFAQVTNTNISNGLLFEGEPYLVINPTNPRNLTAAWMGLKLTNGQLRIAIKTRASLDGGNSWSAVNSLPHFGTGFGSADVSMAYNKTGKLFIAYIDYKQAPDSGGIYVARSIDGGLNWDAPTKAIDMYEVANKRPIDRPWLVMDQSNTTNAGTLYITTKPAPWIAPPNRNYFKVSTDDGFTWSTIANIDGGSNLIGNLIAQPMAAPVTTINGKFCAVYPSYVASQNTFPAYYLATSTNKGQSFSYNTVLASVTTPLDTNFKNGYLLLASPNDSTKMIFLTPLNSAGDADIIGISTNNGGISWNAPKRVNDDAMSNGKAQDMVWGGYNEQGKLAVTWRDRRAAAGTGFWNSGYDFYYALSTDNGTTFSTNKKLSSQFVSFDSILVESGNDFMSCIYVGDTLYSVWGDTRSGKMNIYFCKTLASTNVNIGMNILYADLPSLQISPNPVNNYLNFEVDDQLLNTTLYVIDINGRQIIDFNITESHSKLDISSLPLGSYYLFIESKNGFSNFQRFIKN